MPTFFDRFSALCKESGETPNSLGKKLEIPSGSITAWKNGTIPRMKTLDMLARHFHVSVDYLIGNAEVAFMAEGGENMAVNNLWEQVGNRCLEHALNLLDEKTAPTAATVQTVKGLVDVALSIDMLNLHWAQHWEQKTGYSAAAFRGQLSSQQGAGN